MKNFYVNSSESNYIQLRIESYNTLNHPSLGGPNSGFSTASNSKFGMINGKNGSRTMQFGVKYYF
jgi:hypothetical protein